MNRHQTVAWVLLVFTALLSASVVAFALAGSFYLALLALWSATVFRTIRVPLFRAWQTQSIDPAVRATVLSIDGQTDALGQIAGGPALGALANYGSLRAALTVAGIILAPALLLFVRAGRQGRVACLPLRSQWPPLSYSAVERAEYILPSQQPFMEEKEIAFLFRNIWGQTCAVWRRSGSGTAPRAGWGGCLCPAPTSQAPSVAMPGGPRV